MSKNKFGEKLEELDLSHEEIDRLTQCMKDKKFRDLLKEYAEEISDPENRKKYEEEIAMLERDRGMDVKFINPKPGHVLKTSINGDQKCFINICTNENLGPPKSRPSMQGKTRGMQWSIPHSVSQAREDVDKAGTKCTVYDVVFHPDTYYLLKKDTRFKKMIHDTALDAVERQFGVKLDKVNVKTPKMSFKGLPMSSVIRTPNPNASQESSSSMSSVEQKLQPPYPQTEVKSNGTSAARITSSHQKITNAQSHNKDDPKMTVETTNSHCVDYQKPDYTITHRGLFDIQDYRTTPGKVHNTWPKELVVNIDLPLLSAANSVNLEIFERRLLLDSEKPAKYKLDIELPYPVAENKGYAKFDKSRHRLTVTLEVLPAPHVPGVSIAQTPPLIAEFEKSGDASNKGKEKGCGDLPNTIINPTETESCDNNVELDQKSHGGLIEATESTAEKIITETDTNKKKTNNQNPKFIEDERRHYQQGSDWKDDDLHEYKENDRMNSAPLAKNSAFLIDMVMKYDGLIRRCPQFSFHQDEHYITFIIEVPHIFEQSLWYAVYTHMMQFCCLSECLDDDMINSVFQLWIEFDKGFRIDPQRSRIDVSGNNAVFCLRKAKSEVEWQTFRAGFDKNNLEIRRFSTAHNVCELYTLVFEHAKDVNVSPLSVCDVVKKDNDLVILQFKEKENVDPSHAGKKVVTMKDKSAVNKKNEGKEHKTINEKEAKKQAASIDAKKKTKFADDVEKNTEQSQLQEDSSHQDSDDEIDYSKKIPPAQGSVIIKGEGDNKEVIVDHVTKSAVKLSSESLIFELDDEV